MKCKTGGSAFPLVTESTPDALAQAERLGINMEKYNVQSGMTLRDYFAAHALQGMLSNPAMVGGLSSVAQYSYDYADAMIEARESK